MILIPMSFVDVIAESLERVLNVGNEFTIVKRPVSPMDSSRTIGVFPDSWTADPDDKLIGAANREPYQSNYRITIQNIVIHADTEIGRALYSLDAKAIRAILYRDAAFHVSLVGQSETFMNTIERVLKYDVLRQEYMASRATIGFLYLAKTEFSITTETTQ